MGAAGVMVPQGGALSVHRSVMFKVRLNAFYVDASLRSKSGMRDGRPCVLVGPEGERKTARLLWGFALKRHGNHTAVAAHAKGPSP